MEVFTTDEGGDNARFGIPTGNEKVIKTFSMFGGEGTRTMREIEAFAIVHPDCVTPGMEVSEVPEWLSDIPCGIGESLGKEWA